MTCRYWMVGFALVSCWLGLSAAVCLANGKKHDHDKEAGHHQSSHMQAMYALKEEIPAEYRIMERTPVVPDRESLARGEELYRQQCRVCHGEMGRGDGPAAQGMESTPANFLDLEHSGIYGPGEKYWIIGNGSGETGMPAFGQIAPADRWHLVNYIYHLQAETGAAKEHQHHH